VPRPPAVPPGGAPPAEPAGAANRSVGIALDLLDAFDSDVELTVAELTRRTNVAKSSVSRTCAYLVRRGYLHRVGPGRYRLGMRLLELGHLVKIRTGLDTAAHEVLTELAAQLRCAVHLGVPDGAEVLFVERIEPTAHQRYATERWRRSPVHRSSCGKVLAAFLPKVLDARLRAGLPARTGYTIVVPTLLVEELERVRERGYATNLEETTIGGGSLAVPVRDPRTGEVVAALALVDNAARLRAEEAALVAALRRGAARLEHAIAAGQLAMPTSSDS
jgi:DNA-binding IclR family transcriptional regulator